MSNFYHLQSSRHDHKITTSKTFKGHIISELLKLKAMTTGLQYQNLRPWHQFLELRFQEIYKSNSAKKLGP